MKIGMPAERLLSDPRLWATESGVVEVKVSVYIQRRRRSRSLGRDNDDCGQRHKKKIRTPSDDQANSGVGTACDAEAGKIADMLV